MDVAPLLARIGLARLPAPDLDGLRALHRAYVGTVPYEALSAQLAEARPLEPRELVARVAGGRGGYCFEVNTALHALLAAAGFDVERRQAHVNGSELCNHMALVVRLDGREHLADAGLGEGPLDPVALEDGATTGGPLPWRVARTAGGWRITQHEYGSIDDVVFGDAPAGLDAFQPHHQRLSSTPESSFVQTLVVQRPFDDRIVTLRARTLAVDGPGRRERDVLPDREAFATVLHDAFGIAPDVLGPGRLSRLWSRAEAQHLRFQAR